MKEKDTYPHVNAPAKLPDALRVNPYTVPNDEYFDDLHERTLQHCRQIETTLTAFAVPDGYFEELENGIMAKITEEKLRSLVADTGFSVPESYFIHMEQQVLADGKIRERAVESGFVVPKQYFDSLQRRITDHSAQGTLTPVRKISRSTGRRIAYAAAACIALLMTFTGIFKLMDSDSTTSSPLASVSDQEILNYLELYGSANDMIYISEHLDDFEEPNIGEAISEVDLEAYLNHTL